MAMQYQAMRSDVRASAPPDARRACERTKEIQLGLGWAEGEGKGGV